MLGKDVGYIQELLYLDCEPLDNAIGGFETQTLNVFISMPNGGKSTMCHHIIKRCFEAQKRVHVTCVEDRPKSFLCKLTACITGIPVSRLRKEFRSLTTDELTQVRRVKELMAKYLKVDFVYGQGVDLIHKTKLEYDLECKVKNIAAPVVDIIDYTGHIAGRSVGDKMYEKMRAAYGARKDFALANNKIAFDFAQVNREGTKRANGDDNLTMADLAGSFDISQVCDNIISINRNMLDRSDHKATLYVAKARDGEAGGIFKVGTKYHVAQYDMASCSWENAPQDYVRDAVKVMSEPEK
jgi:replicative DNA helicase